MPGEDELVVLMTLPFGVEASIIPGVLESVLSNPRLENP